MSKRGKTFSSVILGLYLGSFAWNSNGGMFDEKDFQQCSSPLSTDSIDPEDFLLVEFRNLNEGLPRKQRAAQAILRVLREPVLGPESDYHRLESLGYQFCPVSGKWRKTC